LDDGSVSTLAVIGGDPVLDVPADIDFLSAMKKVTTRIHLALYVNETSQSSSWHIPQSHFLESWGDVLLEGDRYTVQQPLIEPLHGGKSAIEFLTLLAEPTVSLPAEIVRSTFENLNGDMRKGNADTLWRETLHEGIKRCSGSFLARIRSGFTTNPLPRRSLAPELPSSLESNEVTYPQLPPIENGKLEITFRPSPAVYDGRFANLSWLQEMPDPITRITWDNVALISPATAEKLGVKHEEVVRLKFKGREIEIPAYILPGQADGSVAVTLGYGRTAAGKVGGSEKDGVAPVGVNTYKLRTSDAMWFGTGLTVEPTGKMHPLASVAEHFAINSDRVGEDGRKERLGELVREATVAEYQTNPTFAKPSPPAPLPEGERSDASLPKGERKGGGLSLWQEHKYEGHCWGMTVDLSKCVGCGACVVACMAENNVPVVGKERIFRNREMHWLRVDRYFRGDPANPQIVFQPMFCQHCEMAPCEGVCPVGATVHSTEGLNEMVYNRCVGTRYCANNCPYKVRRFNFFNYHKQYEDPDNEVLKMASNPQVTVRMRGVMEKCTYCVQRIETVKIEAKNEKRTIKDGEIRTACQQVCPAGAIVFGDLNDETSEVYRLWKENRSYQVLGELYTKPRTWYLARIRNPNPELEKAEQKEGIQHGGTEGREKKES
jgi:molybdopterin-containing oxidoreductase family iron-sulfur binding subunit